MTDPMVLRAATTGVCVDGRQCRQGPSQAESTSLLRNGAAPGQNASDG